MSNPICVKIQIRMLKELKTHYLSEQQQQREYHRKLNQISASVQLKNMSR